jgi:glycosyltransferase involved in cell wall biosynthesis
MKIAFITNFCPHYRVNTFEVLANYYDVDYYFFSAGNEWYWQQEHGVRQGNFHYRYLPGFKLGRTRITPTLPVELWKQDYDVYIKCINGRFALPVTYQITSIKKRPFILWTGLWQRLQTPLHQAFFPVTRYIYSHANAIVVYGDHVKKYLTFEGVSESKIFTAPHAVNNADYSRPVTVHEQAALRQQLKLSEDQKVILYLGRLEDGKGLDYLLEAFSLLPKNDSVLVFVGTGSRREELEQTVLIKNLSARIRFLGYVPPEQAVVCYSIAYVSILPSVTTPVFKEPWGLVVNEAFNQGVPVIATDAVGAAAGGLLQNGENGFIVPERNSQALAEAIQILLTNRELREQFSLKTKQVIEIWNNEQMVLGFREAIKFVTTS